MNANDVHGSGFDSSVGAEDAKNEFIKGIQNILRLHQKLHDLVGISLEKTPYRGLTPVQALLIYNLGEHEISVGELRSRGFYLGSNVSYNLKKLVNAGYVSQEPSPHDKRSTTVALTNKGNDVRHIIDDLYNEQIQTILETCPLEFPDIRTAVKVLFVWDQFWSQELSNICRPEI